MEPMNCTAHVRAGACEIWVGNQVVTGAQGIAAQLTGLPPEKVIIHNHLIGGGFGRRLGVHYIAKAVCIAQKVDGPVKVIWTREEDLQQALYRPFYFDRFAASLSNGKITVWSHKIAGSLGDGYLGGDVQRGQAFRAPFRSERRVEPRRLSGRGARALRRMPFAPESVSGAGQPQQIRRRRDRRPAGLQHHQ
jgi:hypothetical protein